MDTIRITWHGHACFTLEHRGYVVAIDPYDPTTP
ncbi:MAG: MBL fold metallo-hydrolase, partial [Clostridia bacterium]|nr:MBL fold metallo-hydrolase [Clostridia bacterium]